MLPKCCVYAGRAGTTDTAALEASTQAREAKTASNLNDQKAPGMLHVDVVGCAVY